jgi:phage gp37-like protein
MTAHNRTTHRSGMPAIAFIYVTYYGAYPNQRDDTTMNRWQFDHIIRV